MCGIVGVKNSPDLREVEKMLAGIEYRGPDASRVSRAGRWSLGHARLSILDVDGGAQPMVGRNKGAQIVYNGEIYNFRRLRAELGGPFRTESDTEVVLRLHESGARPEDWLPKLDGMFALAIVDDDGILLARDTLGIKPLYVGLKDGNVVFGSEMKSVLAVTERIMEFPPGHVYTTAEGGRPYLHLRAETVDTETADAVAEELLKRLTESVRTRLISDVPLGVFLSGGLDSSIIAALACKFLPHVETFSVGMEGSADLAAARRVAEYLGTTHRERVFTFDEAIKVLPKVLYHLESFDAALVRSAVPNYFLSGLASQYVKVALSGEGADELFAGYEYLAAFEREDLETELRHITTELHWTNLQRCDRMSMAHGLEVRVPFLDDRRVVEYAMGIPTIHKRGPTGDVEKWILRKAVSGLLPDDIVWRKKVKFAYGSGLGDRFAEWAERQLTDESFTRAQKRFKAFGVRNKEELAYLLVLGKRLPAERVLPLIGRSRSL